MKLLLVLATLFLLTPVATPAAPTPWRAYLDTSTYSCDQPCEIHITIRDADHEPVTGHNVTLSTRYPTQALGTAPLNESGVATFRPAFFQWRDAILFVEVAASTFEFRFAPGNEPPAATTGAPRSQTPAWPGYALLGTGLATIPLALLIRPARGPPATRIGRVRLAFTDHGAPSDPLRHVQPEEALRRFIEDVKANPYDRFRAGTRILRHLRIVRPELSYRTVLTGQLEAETRTQETQYRLVKEPAALVPDKQPPRPTGYEAQRHELPLAQHAAWCPHCQKDGRPTGSERCPACRGTKTHACPTCNRKGTTRCGACRGSGWVGTKPPKPTPSATPTGPVKVNWKR